MRDEAFDTTEGFRERKALQPVDECAGRRFSAVQVERDHCAETVLLARRECVPRVGFKAGIMDGRNRGVRGQKLGNGGAIILLNAQPGVQSSQSAQGQEGIERRTGQAERIAPPTQPFQQGLGLGDGRAANDVAVPVDILRRRVDDDVGAMLDRPLKRRRQEGIVDGDHGAGGPSCGGNSSEVGDTQERVGRRLDPQQRRLARDCGAEGRGVGKIATIELERAFGRERGEQSPAAAIAIVRDEQAVAGLQDRVQHNRDCRHSRRRHNRARAAFEIGKRIAELVTRRVATARVIVGALAAQSLETEVG